MPIFLHKNMTAGLLALLWLCPVPALATEPTEPDPTPAHDLPGMLKRYGIAHCLRLKLEQSGADAPSVDMAATAEGAYFFLGHHEYRVYPLEAFMEVDAFVDDAHYGTMKDEDRTTKNPQRGILLNCLSIFDTPEAAALLGRFAVPAIPLEDRAKQEICTKEISDSLGSAYDAMSHAKYAKALPYLDEALETLEKTHHPSASEPSALMDDSELKLSAARDMQSKGAWEKAAKLKQRILLWRLERCKSHTH